MKSTVASPKIHLIRGEYVILDSDAAAYFQVQTRALNQAVKRNKARFPSELMFQLSKEETDDLRSQFVISSSLKYRPYVFTEIGCWTLAMILKSDVASKKGLELLKTFQKMRDYLQQLPASTAPKLLPSPKAQTLVTVFHINHVENLMIGENQVTQNIHSPEEMIPFFEKVIKIMHKDEAELKNQLQELVQTLKSGQKGTIKDKVALLSDSVQALSNLSPAVAAAKTGLGILLNFLAQL